MKAGKVDVVNFDLASSYPFVKQGVGHVFWDFQTTGPDELRGATTNEVWVSDKFLTREPEGRRGVRAVDRPGGHLDRRIRRTGRRSASTSLRSRGTGGRRGPRSAMIEAVKPAVGEKDVAGLQPASSTRERASR